ncbi:ribose 5-phosphate isomerase B [Faecalicoccus acidiformans]|uniref:Ribose 5-phosphate isomerase B n=1 Tax=Faecalicoccus acidiformans TaxID=915173 RepID=A0A7W8FX46_9FIRM|nr:ribose 5-phosphate isomerase B [Faecalicoccus acidiformans]MBB5185274.1 ribose 5-phosphate isomerase B [Faecalicoccus acidiformans]MDM8203602.1 ribose 5-phosphate isomerase B [Faecalicoccus acidiformans]
MKIAMANDHGAYTYKLEIKKMLEQEGYTVIDCGTNSEESVDYPDYAKACAEKVLSKEADLGIVLCGTGIGISIAANKIKGIRCGLCTNTTMARLTREHNDANILALGQRTTGIETCKDIVHTFIKTPFSNGERHKQRIEKISELEK